MKKYVPNGYQIINLDLTGKTSGTSFAPETEDEKLLHDLLIRYGNDENVKPVLLSITTEQLGTLVAFVIYVGGALKVMDDSMLEIITNDDDKLLWTETEL